METIFLGYLGYSLKNIPKTFHFRIKDTKKILTSLYKAGKIVSVPFHQNFDKFSHFCFNLTEILQL